MRAPLATRLAIGLTAGILLLVQITATRLLSATVSYHGAFGVLGLVMLGLAASAAAVYRDRAGPTLDEDAAARALDRLGITLAGFTVVFVGATAAPIGPAASVGLLLTTAAMGFYAAFYLGGYAVAWLLAQWSRDVSRLYFADLLGAALGCAVAVPLLSTLTPMQILFACGVAAVGAAALLRPSGRARIAIAVALVALLAASVVHPPLFRLRSAKGLDQSSVRYERWNQLSRVTVVPEVPGTREAIAILGGDEAEAEALGRKWASGWGVSARYRGDPPRSLWIQHDTDAGTPLLEGSGTRPLDDFDVLRWDVTALPYWLREGDLDRTFVIGGGGGRDFLTALMFGAERVDVVELNPTVVRVAQDVFGDFSGRPYTRPGVHYEIGEARSALSRSEARYDLIQMSMIDTWAASLSGAMTLSENALYTREAFAVFLEHLADDGILSISRWYGDDNWGETARVLSLMHDALARAGITDPSRHVAVVTTSVSTYEFGVSNCMMKRTPFTDAELARIAEVADRMGFIVLWPTARPATAERLDAGALLREGHRATIGHPFDLTPPTDDRPFFFNLKRPIGSWVKALRERDPRAGSASTAMFAAMTLIILVVARAVVLRPLALVEAIRPASESVRLAQAVPEVAYFVGIGVSFLFVELGLVQRYILFLGHPTYAISVVLLALLLSTAFGALATDRWPGVARWVLPALVALLLATAFAVPPLLHAVHPWPLAARVPLAIALLVPLGACMGVAWPTGVSGLRASGKDRLVPWMWAVNGIGGTLASVVGMWLATSWGYTTLLLAGALGYVGATLLVRRQGWATGSTRA